MLNFRIILTIILLIGCGPVYAYLDPGTGSMLLSSIFALIAVGVYSGKNAIYRVMQFVARIFGGQIKQQKKYGLVFYSEGDQYFSTFFPVLRELVNKGVDFTYLYSDPQDSMKESLPDIDALNIGSGNRAFFFLNRLEAKMCVSTTPGLDVLQIKRSKGVSHYSHLHHAARGAAIYKVFSFDYYDSNLLACQKDLEFFQGLYKRRNLNHQEMHIIGTPYLEYAKEKLCKLPPPNKTEDRKYILLSPTWGKDGLFNRCGEVLVENIVKNPNYHLIIRPHPQTINYEKETIKRIENRLSNYSNWEWDFEKDNLISMNRADLMISDFSGIILDFVYLFKKPVISFPSTLKLDGRDYITKHSLIWFIELYKKITKTIGEEDVLFISSIIDDKLKEDPHSLNEIIEEYNPYYGTSGKRAASVIEEIYGGLS